MSLLTSLAHFFLSTRLGAAFVFVTSVVKMDEAAFRQFMDAMLGFAAGVMLAASYWSLLAPSIEKAAEDPTYGEQYAWVPALVGFFLGCLMMKAADVVLTAMGVGEDETPASDAPVSTRTRSSGREGNSNNPSSGRGQSWKRTMLLVLAITVHNFPEGLAVGVGFGAQDPLNVASDSAAAGTNKAPSKDFLHARNLAIGIGELVFLLLSLHDLRSAAFSCFRILHSLLNVTFFGRSQCCGWCFRSSKFS